jgi:hypothetical protein
MDDRERESLREYVRHWRRVGPLLEEVRLRELRQLDPNVGDPALEDLLALAQFAAPPPAMTCGLVEMQRKFQKFWK